MRRDAIRIFITKCCSVCESLPRGFYDFFFFKSFVIPRRAYAFGLSRQFFYRRKAVLVTSNFAVVFFGRLVKFESSVGGEDPR